MNDLIAWMRLHPAIYAIPGVFLLNLLLGKKSQIDAWCEANPHRAAIYKALRGVMPDPWLLLQAISLLLTKRLPKWPIAVALLGLVALGQTACSHQVSVCHAAAARIDREYFTALVAGCAGYELDVCPARDAIEAQYTVRYDAAAKDCK